jgi:hypothetical protein
MARSLRHGYLRMSGRAIPRFTMGIPFLPHGPRRDYARIYLISQAQKVRPSQAVHPGQFLEELACRARTAAGAYLYGFQEAIRPRRYSFCAYKTNDVASRSRGAD